MGYYANTTNNQCTNCDSSCNKCFGGLNTNCLACNSGSLISSNNSCSSSCGDGYYSSNGVCNVCTLGCKTCNSASICTSCATINGVYYYLNSSACLLQCPSNTYPDASSNQCLTCPAGCSSCQNSSSCLNCSTGKFLIFSTKTC